MNIFRARFTFVLESRRYENRGSEIRLKVMSYINILQLILIGLEKCSKNADFNVVISTRALVVKSNNANQIFKKLWQWLFQLVAFLSVNLNLHKTDYAGDYIKAIVRLNRFLQIKPNRTLRLWDLFF